MGQNYGHYCPEGATWNQSFIGAAPGVMLNVVTFTPRMPETGCRMPPIVFLPGLGSVIDNFRETVMALSERYTVYYIETREKGSSQTEGKAGYSIGEIASDLPPVIEKLGLRAGEYIICGYSLGATVAVSAQKLAGPKPAALILIEPSASFKWPRWLPPLARIGVPLYPIIKPFIKWYMKKFHINAEGDYEMYEINARILDQANPRKLAATVIAVARYEIWNDLKSVEVPVLVIGVSKDKFHSHDEASKIASAIPGSSYSDIETNRRSHSAEAADLISGFCSNNRLANWEK
jgi:pimeloyl-ACP methyl ester carboxylesterase